MTHPIEPLLAERYRREDVRILTQHLQRAGTFRFPTLSTGLFPAAIVESPELAYTGYQNVWIRDNVHVAHGRTALAAILPGECVQPEPAKRRRYDAALLFLIYPVRIVDDAMAATIVADVVGNLAGPYGVRRYLGDSYWCADYKALLDPAERTVDVSADTSARDRLLKPGGEAQWCLFDPIISVIHGLRYRRTGDAGALSRQTAHLNRSLRQLTGRGTAFPPLRCPQSYYREHGRYVPNDITPLLWTQANLRLALHCMEESAAA